MRSEKVITKEKIEGEEKDASCKRKDPRFEHTPRKKNNLNEK